MDNTFVEKRERSPFGKAMLWLFWGWQGLMAFEILRYIIQVRSLSDASNSAEALGYAAGFTVGVILEFALWFVGTVVTGVLALATRGPKTIAKISLDADC